MRWSGRSWLAQDSEQPVHFAGTFIPCVSHSQESYGGDSSLSRRGGRNEEELVRTCLRGGCQGQVTGLPSCPQPLLWIKKGSHSDKELRERIVTGL